MVPPPALTVLISIIGTAMSWPSILPRPDTNGWPSRISATSQEVPPMSKVMMSEIPSARRCRDACGHAAGRARQHRRRRPARRRCEGRHAAIGLHDVFLRRRDAGGGEPAVEIGDIALEDRLQIGVDDGGAQPIVLADLRQHLRRQRNAAFRQFLGDDGADALLMLRIEEREQQAHRDRCGLLRAPERATSSAMPPRRAGAALRRGNRPARVPRRSGCAAPAWAACRT